MATGGAIQYRETTDPNWQAKLEDENPVDRANRKLAQAEALAKCLVGDLEDPFESMNDVLRQNVRWLLADTITEAREAMDKCTLKYQEERS